MPKHRQVTGLGEVVGILEAYENELEMRLGWGERGTGASARFRSGVVKPWNPAKRGGIGVREEFLAWCLANGWSVRRGLARQAKIVLCDARVIEDWREAKVSGAAQSGFPVLLKRREPVVAK